MECAISGSLVVGEVGCEGREGVGTGVKSQLASARVVAGNTSNLYIPACSQPKESPLGMVCELEVREDATAVTEASVRLARAEALRRAQATEGGYDV